MFPIGYYVVSSSLSNSSFIASSSFEISICWYYENLQTGGRVGQLRGCGEGHSTVCKSLCLTGGWIPWQSLDP